MVIEQNVVSKRVNYRVLLSPSLLRPLGSMVFSRVLQRHHRIAHAVVERPDIRRTASTPSTQGVRGALEGVLWPATPSWTDPFAGQAFA
jgi:hypothetical protein